MKQKGQGPPRRKKTKAGDPPKEVIEREGPETKKKITNIKPAWTGPVSGIPGGGQGPGRLGRERTMTGRGSRSPPTTSTGLAALPSPATNGRTGKETRQRHRNEEG